MADQLFLSSSAAEPQRYAGGKPFDFITSDDVDILFGIIRWEHPQVCALILSYVDPKPASKLISLFEPEIQIDLARRIVNMDRTAPVLLEEFEGIIRRKFSLFNESTDVRAGGVESVTSILNLTSRSVEKTIIEGLERENPDLAEEIKMRMFVFEDIVLLDRKVVPALLSKSSPQDFSKAMRGVDQEVIDFILGSVEDSSKAEIKTLREDLGPMRLMDVEAAQQRIVNVLRVMEENGEVIVARPDELVL